MFHFTKLFFCIILILNICFSKSKDESVIDIKKETKKQFERIYGSGWKFKWNVNNTPHRIMGRSISQNFEASSPELSEVAARKFILENQEIFKIDNEMLDLWVNEKHGNIRYLIFNQMYEGIPVWNGRIDFRYRLNGDLVMLGHDAYPNLNVSTYPTIDKQTAILNAQIDFNFNMVLGDEVTSEPELYIWVERELNPIFHLAWYMELFIHSTDQDDELPIHRWRVFVDAHSGEILEKFDVVRQVTVEGHVTGPIKDDPYGIATERGLPHVKVAVTGVGNTYTDENGYYSIDIGDSDRSANVKLEGLYLNTNNQNGSDASITKTISPGTVENFSFGGLNSIPGERDTYYHANLIHDFVKSIDNSFTGGDYIMPATVNIGSEDSYWPCNAYWDYTGINLFSEGGGCAATDQMADVIYHEYGHGLQQFIYDPYTPPYSSSGLSEGCSDYWGMTLTNTPCLGNGFFGDGTCLRDGENNLQYPANSCGGQVHCLGEYIMGSLWKMRENLISLHGYDNGVAISDALFYWGQTGRPSNDLDFLDEILIADDNDGSIENGTPNYMQICNAFETHNLNCPYEGPFAELEFSDSALEFTLAPGQSSNQDISISNVGEFGSIMTFNAGVSPFSSIGDGPDAFGNFWSDSQIDEEIDFEWVNIEEEGILYNFPHNDEAGEEIDIGFNFPFLGQEYTQCIINANGWIGFGSDSDVWENTNIPSSSAPGPAIFGLWDDLNPVNDECNEYCSGNVFYYTDGEKFVVWFNEVAHWWTNFENSFYDFQFILYPSGKIDLNYNSLTGTHTATIGIQDQNGENGLKVAFDQTYLQDQLSLRFSEGPDWVSVFPSSGQVESGSSENLTVQVSSANLTEGLYEGYLRLVTSGGNEGLLVTMMVSDLIQPGDINGDEQINIQDVIFLINFILDIQAPNADQFIAADLNNDNILNVQDVILIVNSILN